MTAPSTRGVDAGAVRAARWAATGLRGGADARASLTDVVRHLLAVQGQELQPALWGASRRVRADARPDRAETNRALAAGELLRTHVLRPTWHLLLPDDARWLVELSAPRVGRLMASTERSWDLGDLRPGTDAVAAAVADGPRTRAEIKAELIARGVLDPDAPGLAFTQMLMHAELERLVISGPPTPDQPWRHQSYATFDDRVPAGYGPLGERFDAEAAVVELWRRYLPGRAFATVNDLRLWADVPVAALRTGLRVLLESGEAVEVPGAGELEGLTLVATPHRADLAGAAPGVGSTTSGGFTPGARGQGPDAELLQAYDELLMSYRETRHVLLDPDLPPFDRAGAYVHAVTVDGVVAGRWRWPGEPSGGSSGGSSGRSNGPATVDVQWSRTPSPAEEAALDRAVADLRDYLRSSP